MFRELKLSEIKRIEGRIDAFFQSNQPPGRTKFEARWKAVTAVEDLLRLLFARRSNSWLYEEALDDRLDMIGLLDRYKYNLKYYLELIDRSSLPEFDHSFEKFGEDGRDYLNLNHAVHNDARLYGKTVDVMAGYYSNWHPILGKPNSDVLLVPRTERDAQYAFMEIAFSDDVDKFTPLPMVASVFVAGNSGVPDGYDEFKLGETFEAIIKSVRRRRDHLQYQFVSSRARDLRNLFFYDYKSVPQNWNFPWCSRDEAMKIFASLLAISLYHVAAIYFGSCRHNLIGGGLNDVCLTLTEQQHVDRLARTSEVERGICQQIVRALRYGEGVASPDPALQPFIPVGTDRLLLPCLMTLSSNLPRNFLSLHARQEKKSFDRQSSAFEDSMVDQFLPDIPPRFRAFFNQKFFGEEIDCLLVDDLNDVMIACELKWSIQPGDAREVYSKAWAVDKKVDQISRKVATLRKNQQKLSQVVGARSGGSWRIEGLVSPQGYLGHPSKLPHEIPIIPFPVLRKAISIGVDLGKTFDVLSSPTWLPRSRIDLALVPNCKRIGNIELHDTGYGVVVNKYSEENLAKYLADAMRLSSSQLRMLEW